MTRVAHIISYYNEGRGAVAFCNVCSAEGLELFGDCPKEVVHTIQPKPIDQTKQTAK